MYSAASHIITYQEVLTHVENYILATIIQRPLSLYTVPPSFVKMGTGSFPGVQSGRGVTMTPHPLLVTW
jgi:hypothetical protein